MIGYRATFVVIAGAGIASAAMSASAAIVVDYHGGATAGQGTYDPNISGIDLVNTGQPSLLAPPTAPTSSLNGTFTAAGLNDGLASTSANGSNANMTYYDQGQVTAGAAVVFNLNTGAGGSPTGYDITSVQSIAGWSDSNIGAQKFQLLLRTEANPNFTDYGTYSNTAGFSSSTTSTSLSTLTSLTDSTGVIASGVTGVELIYMPTGLPQGGSGGGVVIREIDVTGTATQTPEPMSTGLMGITAAGLLSRRRRA